MIYDAALPTQLRTFDPRTRQLTRDMNGLSPYLGEQLSVVDVARYARWHEVPDDTATPMYAEDSCFNISHA